MQQSKRRVVVDLRSWQLVAGVVAWLAGMLLASMIQLPSPIFLVLVGLALMCVILFWCNTNERAMMLLLLCALLGAWRYTLTLPAHDPQAISNFIGQRTVTLRGTVADEPKLQGRGQSRLLNITVNGTSLDQGTTWHNAHGQIAVVTRGTAIEDPYGANYGDTVELSGKLQAPPPHSTPNTLASMAFPRVQVVQAGSYSPMRNSMTGALIWQR